MARPRAFIIAPNRSENPFQVKNVATGVLLIYGPPGKVDWLFRTIDDEAEMFDLLSVVNWNNPEVADYVRERLDEPQRCAFWEVEVRDGDTVETLFQRMLDAERGA